MASPNYPGPAKRPLQESESKGATSRHEGSPNLLEQLREKHSARASANDLIPIPVMIVVFASVWILIVVLMAPNWPTEMSEYLARRHQRIGNYQAALPHMQRLVEKFPERATFQAELAFDLGAVGQFDKAIEHYKKAQELGKAEAEALSDDERRYEPPDFSIPIGLLYRKKGELELAKQYLKDGLAKQPNNAEAHFAMGEISFEQGDFVSASRYFKAVAKDPQLAPRVREYYAKMEKKLFTNVETGG